MTYSSENLVNLNEKYLEINHKCDILLIQLVGFQSKLKNGKAYEYLMQGVGRRLKTLTRCINNIFTIFPPNQIEHLSKEALADIDINLHAFFINTAGIFDNLAWVFVYENNLLGKSKERKVPRNQVGLFYKETQNHLKAELRSYLNTDSMKSWYEKYSKSYRDTLAHRIPLYVPPCLLSEEEAKEYQNIEKQKQALCFKKEFDSNSYDQLSETQKNLGRVSHFFAHSLSEGSDPVYLHAQILSDYATVEEVIDKFCNNFS